MKLPSPKMLAPNTTRMIVYVYIYIYVIHTWIFLLCVINLCLGFTRKKTKNCQVGSSTLHIWKIFFGMFSRVSVWTFAPLFATAKGVRESPKKWSPVPNQLWRPQPSCSCRDIQNCRVPRKKRDHKIAMFGAMNLKICIQRSHRSTEHQNACFSSFFWMPRIYQQKPGENPCLRTANERAWNPMELTPLWNGWWGGWW